jgi:hypothetical protein
MNGNNDPLKESIIRDRMQAVAKAVQRELPDGYGFFVLCFKFNAPPGTHGEYVSNARRKDVVATMKDFIERNPMQTPERN